MRDTVSAISKGTGLSQVKRFLIGFTGRFKISFNNYGVSGSRFRRFDFMT